MQERLCDDVSEVAKAKSKKQNNSETGNRTPVSRVTGGDTSHYTISDLLKANVLDTIISIIPKQITRASSATYLSREIADAFIVHTARSETKLFVLNHAGMLGLSGSSIV